MHGGGGQQRASTDSRGQAETIGVVLVLAMTLIGATVALAFGATALNNARADSQEEAVRNAMTQLDSQVARVALGDSTSQHLALTSGSYHTDPDAGWINITHLNHTGDGDNEVIFNDTLGAVTYSGNGGTVAYQGGGVWQSDGNRSQMISPPEFHYRGSTLTLPIVRVVESDSRSGTVTAKITSASPLTRIYPSDSDYSADLSPYENPVGEGNISVTIQSDYYQAWTDYFRSRTTADITVYDSNETVEVILTTPSILGAFDMPLENNELSLQQLGEGHPVDDFSISLEAKNPGVGGPNRFNNMEWSFKTDGGEEFEIHLSGSPCASSNPNLDISLYYHNGSGTYEGWHTSLDPEGSQDIVNADCGEAVLEINFMNTSELTYTDNIDTTYDTSGHDFASKTTFDQHPSVDGSTEYEDGTDSAELGFLINHYLGLLGPNVDLEVNDDSSGGGNAAGQVDEPDSSGFIDYEQGGGARFITYLHVTENRVNVELD